MIKISKYLFGKLDKQLIKDMKKEILALNEITKVQKDVFLKRLKNSLKID